MSDDSTPESKAYSAGKEMSGNIIYIFKLVTWFIYIYMYICMYVCIYIDNKYRDNKSYIFSLIIYFP